MALLKVANMLVACKVKNNITTINNHKLLQNVQIYYLFVKPFYRCFFFTRDGVIMRITRVLMTWYKFKIQSSKPSHKHIESESQDQNVFHFSEESRGEGSFGA